MLPRQPAAFDSVLLVQALPRNSGTRPGRSPSAWFPVPKAEAQELDAWCRKLVRKALTTDSFNLGPDKFRAEAQADIEAKAEELRLRFIRGARQCAFQSHSVNGTDTSVFSAEMREVISTLPGVDAAFWDFAKGAGDAEAHHGDRALAPQSPRDAWPRAEGENDEVSALVGFCGFMADGGREPTRTGGRCLALCALCHAFHTSRCRDTTLPDELKPGYHLFRRMSALRNELIRIASAAAGWHWIFTKNPDMPQSEVRRVMHEAWQSGTYPRGRINLPWEVWDNDIIDMCAMDLYPQAMPDDLFHPVCG